MTAAPPSRPLVVRLRNWVGDVILGVPALQLLQDHGFALHLLGKGWASPLLAGHGWTVTPLATGFGARVRQLRDLAAPLRAADPGFTRRPDMLVQPFSFSSALEARLAGLRPTGYAYEGRGVLLARRVALPQGVHELVRYWHLACAFLGIQAPVPRRIGLRVAPGAQAAADARLAAAGLRPGFIVLCPFAGGTYDGRDKRWPAFAAFAAAAARELGRPLVLCPGPGEEAEAHALGAQAAVLTGVGLGEYAALLRRAALVVSNDSGPGHLAAALDVPLLSVLGPTDPAQWGAWGPSAQHVQGAAGAWPTVAQVLQPARALLGRTAA